MSEPDYAADIAHMTEKERERFFHIQRKLGGVEIWIDFGGRIGSLHYSKGMLARLDKNGVEFSVAQHEHPNRNVVAHIRVADHWDFYQDVQGQYDADKDCWRYVAVLP